MSSPPPLNALTDAHPEPSPAPAQWTGGWPQSVEAFEAFVELFQDRLVYYAFRRLGAMQDAEDVVQEVFVKAFTQRQQLREVELVASYLYRMTANACHDVLRQRRRMEVVSMDDLGGEAFAEPRGDAFEAAAALEEVRRIEAHLGRLPRRQAEVVRLRVFDELSLLEIARTLNLSMPTVKSRLYHGLQKLRKWLGRERRAS